MSTAAGHHPQRDDLLESLGQVARDLQAPEDDVGRRQRVLDLAVELIPGCDHAGLSVVGRGQITTVAATDDVVWQGDKAQYELGSGPCVDAVQAEHTVLCRDLSRDRRWPAWSAWAVRHLHVRSMLGVLLFTHARRYGALNLYGDRAGAFGGDDLIMAEALAAQVAVALVTADEIAQRSTAMVNRTLIGQAQGIVMERYGIGADAAFALLRRISQDTNRKLLAVADELVSTRDLPQLPAAATRSQT